MIGSLRGTVIEKGMSAILLEVAGVGYRVAMPGHALEQASVGSPCFVHIHDHIREDAHDLYGFGTPNDLELFERLLGISGVGPKVAMTIMSVGSADVVRRAIMAGDLAMLTSVPGVGKKTAQKIILELKGQLVEPEQASNDDREVLEALQAMGYASVQAREVLKMLSSDPENTSERLREALKILGRR